MSCKVSQVENALEEATCIRKAIESKAKVNDEALAHSLGAYVATTESSSSGSSKTDSDYSDEGYEEPSKNETSNVGVSTQEAETSSHLNEQQLVDILRSCNFNWIEFVHIISNILHNKSLDEIETLLNCFAQNLPNLNVNEDEWHLVNQSRQAYAIQRRQIEKEVSIDTNWFCQNQISKILIHWVECKIHWMRLARQS